MVLKIVKTVWPVMLTYVAIGAPCGMIMAQTGMEPWMVFALSSTFVTGSGQLMVCNLWLAGVPAPSIIASVAAISSRFALYSASIAPHLTGASKRQALAVSATLTEEAYGISLARLVEGEDWGPRESFVLNAILIATWGVSCTTGAIVGAVVDVPTALAGFVCTSLFICLLFSQRLSCGNIVAAVLAAVSVAICKFLGWMNIACRQVCSSALSRRSRAMPSSREGALAMPVNEFLVLWLSSWAAIAFFRIAPAFALRGRTLSPRVTEALGYIPPAAFAALVANDLISPGAFDAGLWQGLIPWIAAAGVVVVAVKTKSMLWCCVSGIVLYIVLSLI